MSSLRRHIDSIAFQLQANAWIKAILLSVSLGLVSTRMGMDRIIAISFVTVSTAFIAWYLGAFRSKKAQAVQILHERVDGLEFSLELLQKQNPNIAERLQLDRISSKLPPKIWVIQKGLATFFIGLILAFACSFIPEGMFDVSQKQLLNHPDTESIPAVLVADTPVLLSQTQVEIASPSYTGIPLRRQEHLDISALKTSKIVWNLDFQNAHELDVFLVNSAGERLAFSGSDAGYRLEEELIGSGIYSIQAFQDDKLVYESDFYTLESIEDQSPQILPEEKETYTFFFSGNNPKRSLSAQISDDFKVKEVYVVATLVRGRGENVKFRESRLSVETRPFSSKTVGVVLDLNSLDFQPGDELYYYWVAIDNKIPDANVTRTDTYFIKYFDNSEESNAILEGMAIQVLPEYFRSQRQIIIDTEKLLADKSKLSEQVFNSTSNEIGFDQKLLRLRYGQYVGEEFETAAVGVVLDVPEDGDLLRGYMHLHDQEGEHEEGISAAPPAQDHDHEHHAEESEEGSMEQLMSQYIHAHDSEEMNTYFEESVRGALKAAMEQMWQAELYMRLFEPEKALPYQHKALELLKTVQQKSRVYVKRTSYDPPPIKEDEKRLTGELKDLDKEIKKEQLALDQQIEPLASATLGFLAKTELSAQDRQVVRELGNLWTEKMQNSKLADWNLVLQLQQLESGKLDESGKTQLREKLYPLAKNYKNPDASYLSNEALKAAFRKNLR